MKAIAALLAAVAAGATGGLLLGVMAGSAGPGVALGAALIALLAGALTLRAKLPAGERPRGWIAWGMIAVFIWFALGAFCRVIFTRGDSLAFLSPNNLGDLSIHITLIRHLASGASFWPANPIFASQGLHYPFGVDWVNSLLLLAGVPLIGGLVWAGLTGAAATGVMLWRWGGAFALAGFLFNGGLAAWRWWETGVLADFQGEVAWKSIPLAMFITQRGLLYAIPAGLLLLWSWRERFFRDQRGIPFPLEVLLYATMPFFHLHTFLFLSWMLAAWGLIALLTRDAEALRRLLALVGAALIPASLLVWMLTGGFAAGRSIHWQPGWMQGDQGALWFWLENFGVLPLLAFGLLGLLIHHRDDWPREDLALVAPALALGITACFVMFAAWEWDNTKIFLWCYLALLPSLGRLLARWPLPWRTVACLLLFTSGALSLMGGLGGPGYELAKRSELDALEEKIAHLPPDTVFAGVPTYNHPLLLLGRKMVMGYEGHLSSHGIDYAAQKVDLDLLLTGAPDANAAARRLKADYLYLHGMLYPLPLPEEQ